MKKNALLVCLYSLVCLFSNQLVAMTNLSQIPKEDAQRIEKLLTYLFVDESFAYTLFGSKPMSTIGHNKNTPATYKKLYPHPIFELESWWQTWEKYNQLFPMKGLFLFTQYGLAQNGDEWFQIFLINEVNALRVIDNNLSFFQKKLGLEFSSREILQHIISSHNLSKDGLSDSQALLGLLLGYGRRNAVGFEKYFSRGKKLRFLSRPPRNSAEMLQVETDMLAIPYFSSFSNKESFQILKKYKQERDMMIERYSESNFLDSILARLKLPKNHNTKDLPSVGINSKKF